MANQTNDIPERYKEYEIKIWWDENFDYWYAMAIRYHSVNAQLRPEFLGFQGPDKEELWHTLKKFIDHRKL